MEDALEMHPKKVFERRVESGLGHYKQLIKPRASGSTDPGFRITGNLLENGGPEMPESNFSQSEI